MLINILIIFFLFLIIYQFLASSVREGLETAPGPFMEYPDDPMILGKQNAGNIEVLRAEVQKVSTLDPRVTQLETDVKNLNEQLAAIQEQNAEAVSSFGNSINSFNGTEEDGAEDGEVVTGEGVVEGEADGDWGSSFGMGGDEGEAGAEEEEKEGESSSWTSFGTESFQNKYVLKHYF